MKKKIGKMRGVLLLTFALFLTACGTGGADAQSASYGNSQAAVVERQSGSGENESTAGGSQDPVSATLDNIPAYSGTPYVVIDDNEPDFTEDELTDQSYESYSDLDELGRCGVASVQHWDRSDADREKRKDWTGETVRVADNKI